jgi:hypothetical protein
MGHSVRTAQLAAGTTVPAAAYTTVYTVPTGVTVILKDTWLYNIAGTPNLIALKLLTPGGAFVQWHIKTMSGGEQFHAKTEWTVMLPGDVVQLYSAQANACSYWLSGTELDGVSPL